MPRLSPEELATRRLGMGATCIVEANGVAPWAGAGPMRLFNEKTGIVSPDDADERDDDREDWLEWGHVQEGPIADWYERKMGVKLQLGGPVTSPEMPNFWATLDRTIIGANKLVEVKNVGSPQLYRHWDTSSPDGVPNYVRAQVTVQMRFHGARECDVAASIGGRPPHVWTVFYDAELADLLMAGALAFWQLVQDGTPPPLDATPASRAYLLSKYPANVDPIMLEAGPGHDAMAQRRAECAGEEKRACLEKRRLDAELMLAIGDANGIQGNGWKLTWRLNKNGVRMPRFTGGSDDE